MPGSGMAELGNIDTEGPSVELLPAGRTSNKLYEPAVEAANWKLPGDCG